MAAKLNNADRGKAFRSDIVCLLDVFPRFIVANNEASKVMEAFF
ncbi:hypothetical protein [Peribacillus muralis]